MSDILLELHFAGTVDVQLVETRFEGALLKGPKISIRGKTSGAFANVGNFQWTSAVRAFCVLCVRTVLALGHRELREVSQISGLRGSLASSLDYALSKQPAWLREIGGLDNQGNAYVRRLIVRTNPECKRPGPVILGVNSRVLAFDRIHIFWEKTRVETVDGLRSLLSALDTEAGKPQPTHFLVNRAA